MSNTKFRFTDNQKTKLIGVTGLLFFALSFTFPALNRQFFVGDVLVNINIMFVVGSLLFGYSILHHFYTRKRR